MRAIGARAPWLRPCPFERSNGFTGLRESR